MKTNTQPNSLASMPRLKLLLRYSKGILNPRQRWQGLWECIHVNGSSLWLYSNTPTVLGAFVMFLDRFPMNVHYTMTEASLRTLLSGVFYRITFSDRPRNTYARTHLFKRLKQVSEWKRQSRWRLFNLLTFLFALTLWDVFFLEASSVRYIHQPREPFSLIKRMVCYLYQWSVWSVTCTSNMCGMLPVPVVCVICYLHQWPVWSVTCTSGLCGLLPVPVACTVCYLYQWSVWFATSTIGLLPVPVVCVVWYLYQ